MVPVLRGAMKMLLRPSPEKSGAQGRNKGRDKKTLRPSVKSLIFLYNIYFFLLKGCNKEIY